MTRGAVKDSGPIIVGPAAKSVTARKKNIFPNVFSHPYVLQLLGLDGAESSTKAGIEPLVLSDGAFDPRTGGGVAIKTEFTLDSQKRLRSVTVNYLAMQPDGRTITSKLAEISFRAYPHYVSIDKMSVLGRAISPEHDDRVLRLFGALQRIHTDIRNMDFPQIGKIFHDFQIAGLIGEKLHIPGMSPDGGFDFQPAVPSDNPSTTQMVLPRAFLMELLGIAQNDIESTYDFGTGRNKMEVDRQNAAIFNCHSAIEKQKAGGKLTVVAQPMNGAAKNSIPDLLGVRWTEKGDEAQIDSLLLLGEEGKNLSAAERQKRLGIVNKSIKDLRTRRYPHIPDYLAEFDQRDVINKRALAPKLDEHKQMIAIPFGGHNDREYLSGFGGTIGGNCKGLFTCWRDPQGQMQRKGAIIDLGITFWKSDVLRDTKNGNWDYVIPDIVEHLPHIDDFFATHLHADHLDGYVDYIARQLMIGKTIHAEAYVWRVLEQKLKKRKIPKKYWPKKNVLQGKGFVHINSGGERVMSVYYSTDSVPHSTGNTVFFACPPPYRCDEHGKALPGAQVENPHFWKYGNLGDMSFGRYNLPGYTGIKPPDTGLEEDLFNAYKKGLVEAYPDTPKPQRAQLGRVSLVECDPTSIHRDGFAPDVVDFEENMVRLNDWFSEKGVVLLGLSTAKRMHEAALRFANRTSRDISVFGAYKEDRFTDMSVMGVNTRVLPRDMEGRNVQKYLDWHAGVLGIKASTYYRRTANDWYDALVGSPERTFILGTGSQGTAIEKDAFGTQVAEFRSLLQLDPRYRPTAFGLDLRNFLFIYAQGAIPGNEETQYAQVKATAFDHDVTVAVSIHDGARFYNLKEPQRSRILADLDKRGDRYTIEPENGLFIHKFALYPPGHGWKEDYRQGFFPWFKRNGVQMVSAQHFGRVESVRITHDLAAEAKLKTPKRIIPNHTAYTLDNGGQDFNVICQVAPSFILARQNRRTDQYHGGTTEYKRVTIASGETGTNLDGLFISDNAVYTQDFGKAELDEALYEAKERPLLRLRRAVGNALKDIAPKLSERRHLSTSGIRIPAVPRHDHLEVA